MATPLVATKLYVPKPGADAVRRPRLIARLSRRPGSRLTLVSAPAGFGKTTLLAEWLADASTKTRFVAWLSLDQTDSEPGAFWSHVIQSLQTVADVGGAILPALQSGEPPNESMFATLLNELGNAPGEFDLVLDDYHVVERAEIHAGLAFVLDHLPPNVHVVVSTRADPPIPLARLRARGQLIEIRSGDLRFSAEEASAYLNEVMDLGLTADSVVNLESRTEGWIAALQLAALSLHGRRDTAAFIASFAGNDRYVFDFLVEEVLQRLPPEIRDFLLRTCFLDRLSGALCDAVLATTGGAEMLEELRRQNLFIVSLDDRRQWYRYHHLFAEVLQAHLSEEARRDLPALHRRASDWYEQQGQRSDAIRHAFAGGDHERAAGLIETAMPELRRTRQEVVLRDWLLALPDPLVRADPVLGVGLVGALLANGEFDGIDARLEDAERALAAGPVPPERSNDLERARLPGQIELYRAAMAQVRGNVPAMTAHAQSSLERFPEGDHLGHAAAAGLLGIAFWTRGELETARRWWSECYAGLETIGHVADALGVTTALAEITTALGRLNEVARLYDRAMQLATRHHGYVPRGLSDIHAGLGDLHRERGDLQAARKHIERSRELGEQAGLGPHRYRWCVAMAGLLQAEGDLPGAIEQLEEAERVYVADFFPNMRPVAARIARLRITLGQLGEARRWSMANSINPDDELSCLREFEHLTLARLLIAEHRSGKSDRASDAVLAFLDRLEEAADRGGRTGSVIEILMLRALAFGAHGDRAAAVVALERAVTLAEPEGYCRLFVDAGHPMQELLGLALKKAIAPAYTRALLAAFETGEFGPQARGPDMIEPLSERELDVLRLLRSDLDGPAIARELMVSLNTMRTHTKNIYEKLGVTSRRSAMRRAEELNLFQRRPQP